MSATLTKIQTLVANGESMLSEHAYYSLINLANPFTWSGAYVKVRLRQLFLPIIRTKSNAKLSPCRYRFGCTRTISADCLTCPNWNSRMVITIGCIIY